ncbi:ABC transporter substrate-binding protein [Streptomyces sp. SL13]|uniref:ABC transporter substrate-binding protein n=1 Tax=Streptantibioticus silvisoli TaxID=2705255 RepID=A0AA90GYS5_9ACTN|nr:ABC transporter substrate-binding protein [Streptantibioticus silvisoli]MDI5967793.1 ABC transporter substrate-binding protein [Streptantibioticus silvisoli]
MTSTNPPARRRSRLPAAVLTSGALVLLAACGASGGSGGSPATGAAAGKAPATAIPTRDVVSAVHADPALRAELPASVRAAGALTLGTTLSPGTSTLPHSGETPDGRTVGLDVDLRNAVAKVLGITWKVQNGTFPTVIPGVQNGRYDVGQDNFGVTADREKVVDFATYLNDGQAFLGASGLKLKAVRDLTDLCGLTVATSPGSTFQQILTRGAARCARAGKRPYTVQYFTDSAPIFLGLANGKVDVYFGPTLSLKYDSTHVPNTTFLGQISSTPVGFVTRKGSPLSKPLSDAVNKLIADGDYRKIFDKWGVGDIGITTSRVNPAATL